jgi:hypothetical protein
MSRPSLLILEGDEIELNDDEQEFCNILGIDDLDFNLIANGPRSLSGDDYGYLEEKYPEYMGIWPLIAKAAGFIVKGAVAAGKKIAEAVTNKKKKDAATKAAKATAAAAAAAALVAQQQKAKDQQKTLMMIGIPVAALALLFLLKK